MVKSRVYLSVLFFFSSRRRHTRYWRDWSSDVCSSDLPFHAFDVLVTGDQVSEPKPHPEPYLTAASRLAVEIADCVAIEDSPPGLASATAAGAVAIGVPHMVPLDPASANVIWTSLDGRGIDDIAAVAEFAGAAR